MKKCMGIGEVTVMEVTQIGVRTRAQAQAMAAAATGKRKKVNGGEELRPTKSVAKLKRRRRVHVATENLAQVASSENLERRTLSDDRCSCHVLSSCCSSNSSSKFSQASSENADLEHGIQDDSVEVEISTCNLDSKKRRETTNSSDLQAEEGELESTPDPSEANSRSILSPEKMPSAGELEDFFAAAEKDLEKRFAEKYNYDIAKDVPLEGRYEWVLLKP